MTNNYVSCFASLEFFFIGGQKNFLVQYRLSFSSIPSRRKKTFDKNDNRNLVMPDLFNSLMLLSGSGRILLFFADLSTFSKKKFFNFLLSWVGCSVL